MKTAKSRRRFVHLRTAHGFAIGTLTCCIAVPAVLAVSCLLVDIGLSTYYQQKVKFILKQVANAAINLPDNTDIREYVQRNSAALSRASGVTATFLITRVETVDSADGESLEFTLQGLFPLLPNTILPSVITVQEKLVLTKALNRQYGEMSHFAFPLANLYPDRGPSVFTPVIRPLKEYPIWSFQQDPTIESAHLIEGKAPVVTTNGPYDAAFIGKESLY